MKIDLIIISGLLVIISFLPFILIPLLRSREVEKFKNKFKEEALALGLNISYQLSWNTNMAGIDILKRQFLLIQNFNNEFTIQHVNLNSVQLIKLVTENRITVLNKKSIESLSRVNLEFYENNLIEPITVNLFNYDLNYTQDLEVKNAQKLVSELQKYVIAKPVLKHTA
ncbi:MAG TPA: hypothetical protein VK941_09670 [Gillisia sp.]|nr:hypothetical protein [Gillisia sp.]